MSGAHTPGPLEVQIGSTCSGAWPEIVQRCIDPNTKEEWFREIGRTESAFVEKSNRGLPGTYNEKPSRFKPTDDSAEAIANAHLFAGAAGMLAALICEEALFAGPEKGWPVLKTYGWPGTPEGETDREFVRRLRREAITNATTISDMKGGD